MAHAVRLRLLLHRLGFQLRLLRRQLARWLARRRGLTQASYVKGKLVSDMKRAIAILAFLFGILGASAAIALEDGPRRSRLGGMLTER